MEVRRVLRKFANLNIMSRERVGKSVVKHEQCCVRLHDIVFELCKKMEVDEKKKWHLCLINAYRLRLRDGEVTDARPGAWWKVKDDGHVSGNLSRHLIASGFRRELEALLCDVRWTLRRYEMGGWAALDLDFKRIFAHQGGSEEEGIRELHSMLKSCWAQLRLNQSLLGFYDFGCFSKEERRGGNVSEYLKSVEKHIASPWLRPMTKCVFRADNGEQSRWAFRGSIFDIAVSWSSERVVILSPNSIEVWPLKSHEWLLRILIVTDERAWCVAISEDAKLIVSGHEDGSVRRWDACTSEPVGERKHNHTKCVYSVGMRGNLIVSCSSDGLLFRCNVATGEAIGNVLQGHGDTVDRIAISGDGKMIVSSSEDETIRRWDADMGEVIGSPLRGHSCHVTSAATSSDGKWIVSGDIEGTVRRWRACTGEAIGEPLGSDNGYVDCVAISENDKYIASGSTDGEIRPWDALSEEAIGLPSLGSNSEVNAVAVSREGNLVLSGSVDGTVRHWDISRQGNVSEKHQPLALRKEMPRISCFILSADGKRAVSGLLDNVVQKWDSSAGEAVGPRMGGGGAVECVAISKDGTLIVSGGDDGTVQRWDASTGESIGEPMYCHSDLLYVNTIVISDDGKLIVTGSNEKAVRQWDARNGEAIGKAMEHSGGVWEPGISPDGSVIVSGVDDNSMIRWNAETGEQIGDPIKVAGLARNIVISYDGATIACGTPFNDFVKQLETATGEPVCERMKWSEGQHVLDEMRRARL